MVCAIRGDIVFDGDGGNIACVVVAIAMCVYRRSLISVAARIRRA